MNYNRDTDDTVAFTANPNVCFRLNLHVFLAILNHVIYHVYTYQMIIYDMNVSSDVI